MKKTIVLVVSMTQESDGVRCDLQTLGDQKPTGWVPGTTETGPNCFGVIKLPGTMPVELPQKFIDDVGGTMLRSVKGEIALLLADASFEKA